MSLVTQFNGNGPIFLIPLTSPDKQIWWEQNGKKIVGFLNMFTRHAYQKVFDKAQKIYK